MLSMLLVFVHLLATSMALGAIVATDLRLLSKLAQDRVRIAPPNEFVARIVMVALLLLYVTGAAIVAVGLLGNPAYLDNPKLQAKILLVVVLTLNAFVLHKVTFPRLAKGRRVARWHVADWILVAVPVAVSNFLWMFVAFLGIARPWNNALPLGDILEIAASLYLAAQLGVFLILAMAARSPGPGGDSLFDKLKRSLASVGSLGRPLEMADASRSARRRRSKGRRVAVPAMTAANSASSPESSPGSRPESDDDGLPTLADEVHPVTAPGALSTRPPLRLVGGADAYENTQRRAR